jgi:EamA domain-containing membrane protein RarD
MVVTAALVCYSIAIITEQRKGAVSRFVLVFLTLGIILDISSTALMILGSDNIPLTVHGFLGYSALTVMLVDTVLIWRHWLKHGTAKLSRRLNLYTRAAYGWWVIAYIAGAIISMVV